MAEPKQQNSRDARLRALRGSIKSIAERKRLLTPVPAPRPVPALAPRRRPIPRREAQRMQNERPAIAKGEVDATQKAQKQTKFLYAVFCMIAVAAICTAGLAGLAVTHVRNVNSSRREYAGLRDSMPPMPPAETAGPAEAEEMEPLVPQMRKISAFDQSMRRVNPEYICWLSMRGTMIDYPVARAGDNEKYLNVSFSGEENRLGALFMDYRCIGETVPNIIVYGHNTTDGDMFGGLRRFLDEQYLAEHPAISLRINDRAVKYEIFAARKTDVNDPAYCVDFSRPGSFASFAESCGAPTGAAQIITLSTCVSGLDKDERVIVQGVLSED